MAHTGVTQMRELATWGHGAPVQQLKGPTPHIQHVAIALVHELIQCEAPPHEHARLTVLAKDDVIVAQWGRRSNLRAFLTASGYDIGDPFNPCDMCCFQTRRARDK